MLPPMLHPNDIKPTPIGKRPIPRNSHGISGPISGLDSLGSHSY
jgi:hypothetical protein